MIRKFKSILSGACWLSILACSCVNQISIDEEDETTDIPILFEDKGLQKLTYEKIESPQTGIYLLKMKPDFSSIDGMSNIACRIEKNGIIPTKEIFFPNEKEKFHLISYFPFHKESCKDIIDSIYVSIPPNQSTLESFLESDFMVAQKENVIATTKKIQLEHQHQCAILSILMRTEKVGDTDKLYKEKPTLLMKNLHLSGAFRFDDNSFILSSSTKDVIPYGSWKKDGRKLNGMKAIVLPQTIQANTEFAEIKIGDHTYSCRTSHDFDLLQGKDNHIIINYDPLVGIDSITAEITDWEEGESTEINPEEIYESDTLDIGKIDFDQNPIYWVYHKGKQVLQLCREFIHTEDFAGQAIVAYPIHNNIANLSNGILLNMQNDSARCIYGGKIDWDTVHNVVRYDTGFQPPIRYLFMDESFDILFQKSGKALQLYSLPFELTDQRKDERKCYKIVKIGTQYWMQSNLSTVFYNDNSEITHRTTNSYHKTTAAYFTHGTDIFYNKAAVMKGKLPPKGYRIPTMDDWAKLRSYIQNDASTLKMKGKWSNPDLLCTNWTDFDATPIGIFAEANAKPESVFDYEGTYLGLWSTNSTQDDIGEHVVLISNRKRNVINGSYSDFSGYSIRCIKE